MKKPIFLSLITIALCCGLNLAYADLTDSAHPLSASIAMTDVKLKTYMEQQLMLTIFSQIQARQNQVVLDLIRQDATLLEIRNAQGQTPLMFAIYHDNHALAQQLILVGADVNAQDDIKNSPFLYAGAEGDDETLKLALSHGARFDIYNRYGGTALIPAAEKGHINNVQLLANTPNFPLDHVNDLGWTALMDAIVLGQGDATHLAIIDILLKAGANPNIPDNQGVTALTHAKQKGYHKIVKLLQAYQAK